MCGIVAYLGGKDSLDIILNGLKRLEYRGYDSAGIAVYNGSTIACCKSKGKISKLEKSLSKRYSMSYGSKTYKNHQRNRIGMLCLYLYSFTEFCLS